jgi:hypothetical protein
MSEEMFYDEMIGRWLTPSEYDEYVCLMFEEMTQNQIDIKAGIESDLMDNI